MPDQTRDPTETQQVAQQPARQRIPMRAKKRLLAKAMAKMEASGDIRELSFYLTRLRAEGDENGNTELDEVLLGQITELVASRRELSGVVTKLKDKLDELLRPPLYPARFIEAVIHGEQQLARVNHGGQDRFVNFSETVTTQDCSAGDEVFLCHERNALVGRYNSSQPGTGETATLSRITEDGHALITDRDTEIVVELGRDLQKVNLEPGDRLLWDRQSRVATRRVESGPREGYEDIDAGLELRLGGVDHVHETVLERFVAGITHSDLAQRYGVADGGMQRLLLQGPPGTGKTTLMRMVAARIARATGQKCRVVIVSGAQLYSAYVGETERNIRRCFATLQNYDGAGIIFFDEIDAIGRTRGQLSGFHHDTFLVTLLAEMEGMSDSNVAVIASTNRADVLDPALRSRFAWEIDMPRPDMAAARDIFDIHLGAELPYRPNGRQAPMTRRALIEAGVGALFDPNGDNHIATLQFRGGEQRDVAARELISGRLIEQLCVAARMNAFARQCGGGADGLVQEDMQQATAEAIARLRKTLTRQNAKSFLTDIDEDTDIVAVETAQPQSNGRQFSRTTTSNTAATEAQT